LSLFDINLQNYSIEFEHWKKNVNRINSLLVFSEIVHLYDEEIEKQRQEKIEKLRLKYKDIDPLGEEDWGDEED